MTSFSELPNTVAATLGRPDSAAAGRRRVHSGCSAELGEADPPRLRGRPSAVSCLRRGVEDPRLHPRFRCRQGDPQELGAACPEARAAGPRSSEDSGAHRRIRLILWPPISHPGEPGTRATAATLRRPTTELEIFCSCVYPDSGGCARPERAGELRRCRFVATPRHKNPHR